MCLDFQPNGQITGRGGDFGGPFNITSQVFAVSPMYLGIYPALAVRTVKRL